MIKVRKRTAKKVKNRVKRHLRVRKKIFGTPERPRLAVFKSNAHMYAQIIDDVNGVTLVAASTLTKDVNEKIKSGSNCEAAKEVGLKVAALAKEKNIENVVFDKGGFLYHGRVKALADGAREGGLKF